MSEVFVLTVKEPYATAMCCGVVTALVHKLKLTGKTCLVHVAKDTDLSDKECAAYFRKIGEAERTAKLYDHLDADKEFNPGELDESEDSALVANLMAWAQDDVDVHGKIIGIVTFAEDSEPIANRHRNFVDTFQVFPAEKFRAHKGAINLMPWTGEKFWA